MSPRHLYLGLCVLGTVLPFSQLLPFLRQHGLDAHEFVAQLFAKPVSGFFGLDVIVSSITLWTFVVIDGQRAGLKHLWVPIAANLTVGVSLGLPLFLYMREARRKANGVACGAAGDPGDWCRLTGACSRRTGYVPGLRPGNGPWRMLWNEG